MRRFFILLSAAVGAWALPAGAQDVVDCSPRPLQQDSKNVVVTFHADRGNQGLKGLAASVPVYAHTGVITAGSDEWSHAPAWLDNSPKYKLKYVAPDTYTLDIGTIAAYYGITDAKEPVRLYNLQGYEIKNPVPGTLYIRVQGDNVRKVIY